jgi:Ni/Co efflux regulator RcnB
MNMAYTGEPIMKSKIALIATLAALAAFATTAASAADADKKYTKEEFKSDVKGAGKGMKDAAVDVGHQVGSGTKKAYKADKAKIKKDVKDRKPGDGSLAKKNDSQPVATPGHN